MKSFACQLLSSIVVGYTQSSNAHSSSESPTTLTSLTPFSCFGIGVVITFGVGGGSNLTVLLSIKSWILFFKAQHQSVSCPGLLEWQAHFAFGLYLGDEVSGLAGGSHNVTKLSFSMCCKAWDNDMPILVNCLFRVSNR